MIYLCAPLSRLRERGWGRGRREEIAYFSANSLSRKRGERSEGAAPDFTFDSIN